MWERVPVASLLVHPGLVFIGYSEMTDTEAFERRVSYFIRNSQEWGPCHTCKTTRVEQEAGGVRGTPGPELLVGFPWGEDG